MNVLQRLVKDEIFLTVDSLVTMVHRMQGELQDSQTTPVPEGRKDKGKGKEREVVFSDVEELDGPPSTKGSESKPR